MRGTSSQRGWNSRKDSSSQRGWNSRKDSDIFHYPFSILHSNANGVSEEVLAKRIIPCLDVKDGRVVKGVNFVGLRDAGDPVELAKFYSQEGADEIVFLDITATSDNRDTIADVVRRTCREVFVPVTVGGGIRTVDDFREILRAGADKISINSSAVKNPDLVNAAAEKYGSQCVVVAIDARANAEMPSGFEVYVAGGRTPTGKDAVAWAKEVYERGVTMEDVCKEMDIRAQKIGNLKKFHVSDHNT